MKKQVFAYLIAGCMLVFAHNSFAQRVTLENLLDKAMTLSQQNEKEKLAEALKDGSIALESEANTRGNDMKAKLLSQAVELKNLIPLATDGTLKTEVLSKVINTIKLVVGANQINNLLSEGKDGLLGNAESLTGSLNLLNAGKEALNVKDQDKLGTLVQAVSETVKKLNGQDAGAKLAASSAKKTLGKIVDLVKGAV